MSNALAHCPLCKHDVPASQLRARREQETREIVEYAVNLIKARHPEWTENDPVCQRCWDYYQSLPTH